MNGERYYTFARSNVRFFMLDTNWLDRVQIAWLEQALRNSTDHWKICVFHHPLYSDGVRHGPSLELRVILEPILIRHGVDVVFSGHDHIYERLHPQKGITYFVAGAGGQSERGIEPTADTAAWFDQDRSFMLVEVGGAEMHFQAVARDGATIDAGAIRPRQKR
jgi:3',5'-cyclic AMP phosphodiesterase CpdA